MLSKLPHDLEDLIYAYRDSIILQRHPMFHDTFPDHMICIKPYFGRLYFSQVFVHPESIGSLYCLYCGQCADPFHEGTVFPHHLACTGHCIFGVEQWRINEEPNIDLLFSLENWILSPLDNYSHNILHLPV